MADGFDDALIGYADRDGFTLAVYAIDLAVDILMHRELMTYEDAKEYFEFNVRGAWVGPQTPIWVDTMLG